MYVLHYAPDNASLIIRLALEELGLPYRAVLVDRARREQDGAAYRALNPQGLIPVLETPEGALFETGAILLWLADRQSMPVSGPVSGPVLGPGPDRPERGMFLAWLFFLSNTLHADLRTLFYPERHVPAEAVAAHHARVSARVAGHFALINTAATKAPALFAAPSALTIYTAVLMRWSVLYPTGWPDWFMLADYPALARLAATIERRPACKRAAEAEGLGDQPFTHPTYACPPEGSAT